MLDTMQATKTTAQGCGVFFALGAYLGLQAKIPAKPRLPHPRSTAAHLRRSYRRVRP